MPHNLHSVTYDRSAPSGGPNGLDLAAQPIHSPGASEAESGTGMGKDASFSFVLHPRFADWLRTEGFHLPDGVVEQERLQAKPKI
jgi:hypothetical protein